MSDEPYENLKFSLAIIYQGLSNWPPFLLRTSIDSFINESADHRYLRQELYASFRTHMSNRTLWTTTEGIHSLSVWLEAFRFWDMPRSLRQDPDPILYCRDLPRQRNHDDEETCPHQKDLALCIAITEERLSFWKTYTGLVSHKI